MVRSIHNERRCFQFVLLNLISHMESQTGSKREYPSADAKKDVDTDVDDDVYVDVDWKEI